jgi:hypothetical protein
MNKNLQSLLIKYNTIDRQYIEEKLKELDNKNLKIFKNIFPNEKVPLYFTKHENENLAITNEYTEWSEYAERNENSILGEYNDNFCRTENNGENYKYPIKLVNGEIVLNSCDDIFTNEIKKSSDLTSLVNLLNNKSKLNLLNYDVNIKNMNLKTDKLIELLDEYNKLDKQYYQLILMIKNINTIVNEREKILDNKNENIEEKQNLFNINKDEVSEIISKKKSFNNKQTTFLYISKIILIILWLILIINFLLVNIKNYI